MMKNNQHLYAVILAGGGGTRLWPKSRNKTPKQFLKLTSKKTLIEITADRMSKLTSWDRIIVITNKKYEKKVKELLPEIPKNNIIGEPDKKETAIAMLVASLYAKSKDEDAVIVNAASDHMIVDEKEYLHVMKGAAKIAAKEDYLVTVGITPTYAHTGFGYIKIGRDIGRINRTISLFKVQQFTEKPNKALAQAYLSTGQYFWNANMYVWSAESITNAFEKHMPEIYELTKELHQCRHKKFIKKLDNIYKKVEKISIDYAISEKADNLVLIPGDFGWNDVGDWKVVYDLGKKDLAGNVTIGEKEQIHTLTIKAKNNLIHTNEKLIALYGVEDLIVVDSEDILMICPKDKSQSVKKLVNRLKEEDKKEYL